MTKQLNKSAIIGHVRQALAEDIGAGDATSIAVVPEDAQLAASLIARESCVVAGMPLVDCVFGELSKRIIIECMIEDGARCEAGKVIARISGPARAILTGERTALNYLQRLSGIATMTANYKNALGESNTVLLDTRKTTPGWRLLEKYAVRQGGGSNHRIGLYDRIMIKDNHRHLAAQTGAGSIERAVAACRDIYPQLEVEVEVDSLDELVSALEAKADYVLLDNMPNEMILEAVSMRNQLNSNSLLEISGNVTLDRIPELARLGADFISSGALTHSVRAIDIGLDCGTKSVYPN
jgi:nicotinate-nucleotide pyrophosphorylase (carboxylating)